ncbi:hypothetical protein K9K85_01495 [Patescibacteria group bacterium]|nr:hypothetical protein [Patescibacteria group bacterium]
MTDLTDQQLRYGKWYLRNKQKLYRFLLWSLVLVNFVFLAIILYQGFLYFKLKENYLTNLEELSKDRIDYLSFQEHFSPQDLNIDALTIIQARPGENQYDLVATVFNPNLDWRVYIEYYFLINGSEKTPPASSFVDPQEKKYLFNLGHSLPFKAKEIEFFISRVSWQRLRSPEKEKLSTLEQLEIKDIDFSYLRSDSEGKILPQISFKAKNNSIYDLWETKFVIALEKDLNLVGLNILSLNQWKSLEEKDLYLNWPLIPDFKQIKIKPEIDLLDPEVFISPLYEH